MLSLIAFANDAKTGPAEVYRRLSREAANDPQKALVYARKALALSQAEEHATSFPDDHYLIAAAFKHLGQFDSSLYYYKLCLKERQAAKADPLLQAEALNGIGIINCQRGVFSEGLAYFTKAQKIYEALKDSVALAKGLNNIANVYYSLDQSERALEYYKKSLAIRLKLGEEQLINSSRVNIANLCVASGQYDTAKYYYNIALEEAKRRSSKEDMAIIKTRLGVMHGEKGEFKECILQVKDALELYRELKDEFGAMGALCDLGTYYNEAGDYDQAIAVSKEALLYAEKMDAKSQLCEITEAISLAYEKKGDYKIAYEYLVKHLNYYTAVQRQEISDKVTELQQRFEVSEKEKKLNELNAERTERELELYRKKNQVNYILFIAAAAILLLSFFYYRYILKQKNIRLKQEQERHEERIQAIEEKRILREKQQNELLHVIINVQEEERRKIAVDIHDGLGQLLSGIKMNLQLALSDTSIAPKTEEILKNIFELNNESITESRSIASDLLPYNIKDFGLVTAIKNLCYKNNQLHISNINFYSNDVPRKLPEQIEITMYRIAQELMNNALKHAKASEIFVQLFFREGKLILQVEDNGLGFSVAEAANKSNSMGLKNIDIRVKLLSGHLEMDSVPGKGTTTLVEFSI